MSAGRSPASEQGAGLAFRIERDLLCTADADGYFISLNSAWERVLGWSREELMRRPLIEFVHPDDVERTMREAAKVVRPDHQLVDFENRYRTRDGGWRWLRWSGRSDGQTWLAVAVDVTEEKVAEQALRRALVGGDLLVYSQPILDQRLDRIVQEELLARLRGAGNSDVIGADDFLPAAERFGLIGIVDGHMATEAATLARGGRPAEVNLSAVSLSDEDLVAHLVRELERVGPAAPRIVFEITETAAVQNLDAARDFVTRLSALGCRFALDDFGTGFGSLTYLRHLPVDFLKIDASFVGEVAHSARDRAVVRAILAIAREFDLVTVAEGVEDAETLRVLRDLRVDHVQGYLVGRPQPLSARPAAPL